MDFKLWLETNNVRDAILGIVSGGVDTDNEEKSHFLSRKTIEFSYSIRSKLKNLGVVKRAPGRSRVISLSQLIDDGVTIGDLVNKVQQAYVVKEGRYESDIDSMARYLDPTREINTQMPESAKTPEKFAEYLRKKGFSEDEVKKAVAARFGVRTVESFVPRILILMRGVSGSGKSTVAKRMAQEMGGVVFSTDDFFEKEGRYEFDPRLLGFNHSKNQKRAEEAMRSGISPIIIDNTNLRAWEMKPYVLAAAENAYKVQIIEPGHEMFPEVDFDEIMRRQKNRSQKSLSDETVTRMINGFQKGVTVRDILNSKSPHFP